jgi:uncharacterized protein (UPF0254 family)
MKTLIKGNPMHLDAIKKKCQSHGVGASIMQLSFFGYDGFYYAEQLGMNINDKVVVADGMRSETLASIPFVEGFVRI